MNEISHKGRVLSVQGDEVKVEIIAKSACAACHAKGLCSASDMASKVVDVRLLPAQSCAVGEEVDVVLGLDLGFKAVMLSYALPLFIFVILAVYLSLMGTDELLIGFVCLGSMVLYYAGLYLMRNRIARKYVFRIKKI